eukprot:CAMPEP_0170170982 /NCGR_PEP_ID=MMETSP0040_2-20121228/4027_1 /TAXON_ID=641309 /ORGANISM="Lotharella oceanica, Strain CCMP622" /LENGTH=183 /DNA_ID=CAMNT_0010410727 /DNA_START=60 /DNA_END=614 /DNA_ORIENTATION=+
MSIKLPGGDSSGSPAPPASPLAFAAASHMKVADGLQRLRPRASNAPGAKVGGALLGLAACKYFRGAFDDALVAAQAAVEELQKESKFASSSSSSPSSSSSTTTTTNDAENKQKQQKQRQQNNHRSRAKDIMIAKAMRWISVISKAMGNKLAAQKARDLAAEHLAQADAALLKVAKNIHDATLQ